MAAYGIYEWLFFLIFKHPGILLPIECMVRIILGAGLKRLILQG